MIELTENCNKIRNRRDLSETENARPIVRRAFYECPSVIIPFRCYSASTTNHVLDTTENCLESLETNAHSIVRSWTHHSALRFGVFRTVCLNLPAQPDEGSPRSVGRSSRLLQASLTWSVKYTHESERNMDYILLYILLPEHATTTTKSTKRRWWLRERRPGERARKASPRAFTLCFELLYIAERVEQM